MERIGQSFGCRFSSCRGVLQGLLSLRLCLYSTFVHRRWFTARENEGNYTESAPTAYLEQKLLLPFTYMEYCFHFWCSVMSTSGWVSVCMCDMCMCLPCECSSFCSGSIKIFLATVKSFLWDIFLGYNCVLKSLSPQLTTPIKWRLQKHQWVVRKGNETKYKMIFSSPQAGLKRNYIKNFNKVCKF